MISFQNMQCVNKAQDLKCHYTLVDTFAVDTWIEILTRENNKKALKALKEMIKVSNELRDEAETKFNPLLEDLKKALNDSKP